MKRDIAVLALVALVVVAPSLVFGPGAIDSAPYNYVWTTGFADRLAHGEVYPRWLTTSFRGLGSPTFYFYPPIAFYITGGIAALGAPVGLAINLGVLLLTFLSGLTMRLWLGGRATRPLLWACIYMFAPYHLEDWYQRAALAEYSAFVWLPLVAWSIECFPARRAAPVLALSYAALILTHLPVALLASLALIAPLALRKFPHLKWADRVLMAAALAVGLALSAIYLTPALSLQSWISRDLLWGPTYLPQNWSILLKESPVSWFLRMRNPPIAAALMLLSAAAGWTAWRARARPPLFWMALAIMTGVLSMGLPAFLWELPIVRQVQFPYRILAITEFAALTCAAMSPRLPLVPVILAGAISMTPYAMIGFQAVYSLRHAKAIEQFNGVLPDALEYLPNGFLSGYYDPIARSVDLRALNVPFVQGPARLLGQQSNGGATVQADAAGLVTIRRFYFPAWQVTRDGHPVAAGPVGKGRLLSFQATPGTYRITRVLLPQEALGAALSLGGVAGLIALSAPLLIRRRTPRPC